MGASISTFLELNTVCCNSIQYQMQETSMASRQMRAFLDTMRDAPPKKQVAPTTETRKELDTFMSEQPVADSFSFEDIRSANCPARQFLPKSHHSKNLILYLHGGGYYTGSSKSHHALLSHLCLTSNTRGIGLDYRLAPEHPYPAALEDALAVYREMAQETPTSNIMIAGDSAGGGLTMACLQSLRDSSEPMPRCAALISPAVDLSIT